MNIHKTALAALIAASFALVDKARAAPPPQVNAQILRQDVALDIAANGSYSKTVDRVVQPLTQQGVEEVAQVKIAYPANFATVKILDAYTETAAGKRIEVVPSAIFTQSTPSALTAPFLSQGTVKNLIFPAVTPGDTLHLKYVEHFSKPYLPGVYAVSEVLAPQLPVQSTAISVTAPKTMPLYFHARGPWHEQQSGRGDTRTVSASTAWPRVDFPPANTAAITQYAPMAVLSTASGWPAIARAYDQLAGNAMQVTPAIRATAQKVADGAGGEVAVARIYHWMQQHVQSVNVDYHHAGFQPPTAQSTFARSLGDSNANVALLCAMLRAQGIAAVPALISPAQRFVPYPGADPFAFNHFLAYVPAYHLFLDTGARYAGVEALPAADQGRPVLITGANPQFTRTPGPTPGLVQAREVQNLTLLRNGDIDGTSVQTAAGWRAMLVRQDVLGDRSGRRLQQFMQNGFYLGGKAGSMHVVDVRNREDLDKPVEMTLQWHDSDAAIPGKQMALLLPTPGTIAATLVPFTSQATRKYPSVLQPVTIQQVMHLHLPAGMQPEQLPQNRNMSTPFGTYTVNYRYADGVLNVDKRLQLTQFVVSPQEYPELHKLALLAVSSERKAVVLHGAG